MADEQSFWESHRTMARLARDAERFAVHLPLVGRVGIPRPDQLAYFAGLAALVALDLIEWPVAVAIAAGQVVVTEHNHRGAAAATHRPGTTTDAGTATTVSAEAAT
ncbi:hypothetical protein G6038_16125 [Rhodococcus sp. 14C212]|uniref:hypothetical protein n=1 Tax=Rhodococcus sp. 14C212 TaxID=2711209 RepID=UPI0013EC882F|nr:hypothetical protein [Rhodococcus sp. 14C212]NGP06981.1 hypothetical protein [Rhodococcus sp. 14C212]